MNAPRKIVKGPTSRRGIARRSTILRAAAPLFAANGVPSTTIRDIGEAAGILSGSLYHHFASKDAIAIALVEEYLLDIIDRYSRIADSERPRLEGVIAASFASMSEHPDACEIFQQHYSYLMQLPGSESIAAANERIQQHWIDAVQADIDAGRFRDDLDPRLVYRFARDAVWHAVRWIQPDGTRSVDDLAAQCSSLFVDGLAKRR